MKPERTSLEGQRQPFKVIKKRIIEIKPMKEPKKYFSLKRLSEVRKHVDNLKIILDCSNATPLRARGNIFMCCFCDMKCGEGPAIKQHTLTHRYLDFEYYILKPTSRFGVILDITNLSCKVCYLKLETLDQLYDHLTKVHAKKFSLDTQKHYVIPFKFINNENKANCAFCNTEFHSIKLLQQHMSAHFKNHVCEFCGAAFLNMQKLRGHSARHSSGDIFKCSHCDKVFDCAAKLKDHVRNIHAQKSKFNKCSYCGEKFKDYRVKRRHEAEIHGHKFPVIQCLGCNKTFKDQRNLKKHKIRCHVIETSKELPKRTTV